MARAALAGGGGGGADARATRRISHGGPVPFGFSYKRLYRTRPDPGGYVKVAALDGRSPGGLLRGGASVAARPTGARSSGGCSAVRDSGYIRALAGRYRDFEAARARARRRSTRYRYPATTFSTTPPRRPRDATDATCCCCPNAPGRARGRGDRRMLALAGGANAQRRSLGRSEVGRRRAGGAATGRRRLASASDQRRGARSAHARLGCGALGLTGARVLLVDGLGSRTGIGLVTRFRGDRFGDRCWGRFRCGVVGV